MKPDEIKRIKKISKRQEELVAEELGASTQANSGATKHGGADVRDLGVLRIECKFTEKKSYSLKLSELEKVRLQAIKGGLEEPVMQINFRDIRTGSDKRFAVIPWSTYLLYREQSIA